MSFLDWTYRTLNPLRLFTNGFGCPLLISDIYHLHNKLKSRNYVECIDIKIKPLFLANNEKIRIKSPAMQYLNLPEYLKYAYLQIIRPQKTKGLCIALSATGDHGLDLRIKRIAIPLADRQSIATIIIETPFYGQRKPAKQKRSALLHVSDILLQGLISIIECNHLYRWALDSNLITTDQPLIICGTSLGGYIGAFVTSSHPFNLPNLISILALCGSNATITYVEGILSHSVDWKILKESLPGLLKAFPKLLPRQQQSWSNEFDLTVQVTSNLMNDFMNMEKWEIPYNPELVTLIQAQLDSYIPQSVNQVKLKKLWNNKPTIRHLNCGHVAGTVLSYYNLIVESIEESLNNYSK